MGQWSFPDQGEGEDKGERRTFFQECFSERVDFETERRGGN